MLLLKSDRLRKKKKRMRRLNPQLLHQRNLMITFCMCSVSELALRFVYESSIVHATIMLGIVKDLAAYAGKVSYIESIIQKLKLCIIQIILAKHFTSYQTIQAFTSKCWRESRERCLRKT